MKKRIIAAIALAALLIGLLAGIIPAVSASTADNYIVGYSKVDINPWIQSDYTDGMGISSDVVTQDPDNIATIKVGPNADIDQQIIRVPLAGYTSASARPTDAMADDNGDGYIGLGDGVFATCTAVTDSYGTTVLYITLDAIGAIDSIVADVKNAIPGAIKEAYGKTVFTNKIMISASHSHEAPDFDNISSRASKEPAMKAYYEYARDQIVQAAVNAYGDQTEATMSKGEVDAKQATKALYPELNNGNGLQMNSVRHFYQYNGYSSTRWFVGSNEFNSFSNLIYSTTFQQDVEYKGGTANYGVVAESNDTMYLLKFTPTNGADPIVLVNWRAHPSFLGGTYEKILSSDYINSMRYEMEQANYRVAFFQGAAGNINPRSLWDSASWNKHLTGFNNSSSGDVTYMDKIMRLSNNSNIYGKALADIALYALETARNTCMTDTLEAGKIATRTMVYAASEENGTSVQPKQLDAIALGEKVLLLVGPGEFFDRYDSNYADHYSSVVTYGKAERSFDWSSFNYKWSHVTKSVDPKNPPQYSVVSGNTEQSDTHVDSTGYSIDNVEYNEWLTLENAATYGTPFFFGYSTSRQGYVPNTMAYEYNTNLPDAYKSTPTLSDGSTIDFQTFSYEVESSNGLDKGQGEIIISKYKEMIDALMSGEGVVTKKCEHCDEIVEWHPLTKDYGRVEQLSSGHYVLTEDIVGENVRNKDILGTVCIDLNGYEYNAQYYNPGADSGKGAYRASAFRLYDDDTTLNIMDLSEEKTGKVVGRGFDADYPTGGTISIYGNNTTFNLYSGTLACDNGNNTATRGGVVGISGNVSAVFNMYGGTIIGGTDKELAGAAVYTGGANNVFNMYDGNIVGGDASKGGAVYLSGPMYAYGGTITAGAATEVGDCVYLSSGSAKVYLSGKTEIAEIYCNMKDTSWINQINVNGNFDGKTQLKFCEAVTVKENLHIGTADKAILGVESITYTHTDGTVYYGVISGNYVQLSTTKPGGFMILDTEDGTLGSKEQLTTAITSYPTTVNDPQQATSYIKLLKDYTGSLTITKNVYLDLNGHSINGNITVISGKTVYCMDSSTDDYDVSDGVYGKITGKISGNVEAIPAGCPISPNEKAAGYTPYHAGYMKIVQTNNGTTETSFHRVDLSLTYINFRPDDLGMSYTSNFSGDQMVKEHVQSFGVAVSIVETPNAENLDTSCGYSTLYDFEAGEGVNKGRSTRLINIMLPTNSYMTNRKNAEMPVYGRAYLLTDSGYIFGDEKVMTLKETVELADLIFANNTNVTLKENTVNMYNTFKSVMDKWEIPNIKAMAEELKDDGVFKLLVLGNSHGVDSTEMLAKVYEAENPGKQIVLGRIYHSGCRLDQHVDFLSGNKAQYIYYKANENGEWPRHPMSQDAVEEDNGNIINGTTMYDALKDENWDAIVMLTGSSHCGRPETYNSDLQTIQSYVKSVLGYTPKFYWHMTWAYPENDVEGDAFTTVNTSNVFQELYNNDQMYMYECIANAVKTKILPDKTFSGIIPAGTAIQNANSSYLDDPQLYRDYTHASDLGRLISAYTWYCTIEGVQLNQIKLTTVPRGVLKSYITAGGTGDMVLTETEAKIVAESVKNALKNPFTVTQSAYTTNS